MVGDLGEWRDELSAISCKALKKVDVVDIEVVHPLDEGDGPVLHRRGDSADGEWGGRHVHPTNWVDNPGPGPVEGLVAGRVVEVPHLNPQDQVRPLGVQGGAVVAGAAVLDVRAERPHLRLYSVEHIGKLRSDLPVLSRSTRHVCVVASLPEEEERIIYETSAEVGYLRVGVERDGRTPMDGGVEPTLVTHDGVQNPGLVGGTGLGNPGVIEAEQWGPHSVAVRRCVVDRDGVVVPYATLEDGK